MRSVLGGCRIDGGQGDDHDPPRSGRQEHGCGRRGGSSGCPDVVNQDYARWHAWRALEVIPPGDPTLRRRQRRLVTVLPYPAQQRHGSGPGQRAGDVGATPTSARTGRGHPRPRPRRHPDVQLAPEQARQIRCRGVSSRCLDVPDRLRHDALVAERRHRDHRMREPDRCTSRRRRADEASRHAGHSPAPGRPQAAQRSGRTTTSRRCTMWPRSHAPVAGRDAHPRAV